jgi:hypothetical protein
MVGNLYPDELESRSRDEFDWGVPPRVFLAVRTSLPGDKASDFLKLIEDDKFKHVSAEE